MNVARAVPKPRKYFSIEQILPDLPKPEELRPYPTTNTMIYEGHEAKIRSISVDPTGQWIVTGSDDNTARIWEISTGRCCYVYRMESPVYNVAWNPNSTKKIIALAVDRFVYLVSAMVGTAEEKEKSMADLEALSAMKISGKIGWMRCTEDQKKLGMFIRITLKSEVQFLSWHRQGDYLISVCPQTSHKGEMVLVHQMSQKKSQRIFRNPKAMIQCAKFHPTKPLLYIATQTMVKVYDLAKMACEKKYKSGFKWISSFDIHPKGDNFILGSYDKKVSWFDEDLSTRAYKTLRHHKAATRKVAFHPSYPMFASCSDDLTINVFHATVYDQLDKNAMIVPLRILRGHTAGKEGLGILDVTWHPVQPWVFSAGADFTARLWT